MNFFGHKPDHKIFPPGPSMNKEVVILESDISDTSTDSVFKHVSEVDPVNPHEPGASTPSQGDKKEDIKS